MIKIKRSTVPFLIGSLASQVINGLSSLVLDGSPKRSFPLIVDRVDIGPVLDQQFKEGHLVELGSKVHAGLGIAVSSCSRICAIK